MTLLILLLLILKSAAKIHFFFEICKKNRFFGVFCLKTDKQQFQEKSKLFQEMSQPF